MRPGVGSAPAFYPPNNLAGVLVDNGKNSEKGGNKINLV
jgi:hypothetical protein